MISILHYHKPISPQGTVQLNCKTHNFRALDLLFFFFFFFWGGATYPWETCRVLPLILRMVPRVNQIMQKLEALSTQTQGHYNNIIFKSSTCHLKELNLSGEDKNHFSQPPKLNLIDFKTLDLLKFYI
jgi:hypothetical protein